MSVGSIANLRGSNRKLSSAVMSLDVAITDGAGGQVTSFGGGGTQYTEGDTDATITGTAVLAEGSGDTLVAVAGSTGRPAVGAVGLVTRPVLPSCESTSILVRMDDANGSTTLVSSQANLRHHVFAYVITSTVVGPSSCAFRSSANDRWGLLVGSGSSGVTGANLAVPAPSALFKTDAGEALTFSASSTGLYKISFSYFTEA